MFIGRNIFHSNNSRIISQPTKRKNLVTNQKEKRKCNHTLGLICQETEMYFSACKVEPRSTENNF